MDSNPYLAVLLGLTLNTISQRTLPCAFEGGSWEGRVFLLGLQIKDESKEREDVTPAVPSPPPAPDASVSLVYACGKGGCTCIPSL